MPRAFRLVAASAIVAAASFVIHADATPPSQAAEIQLQLGDMFFSEGRYQDALDAYQQRAEGRRARRDGAAGRAPA